MSANTDFSIITELPGSPATQAQLTRLVQRYRLAVERSDGKRVLEVACGAGLGLGWLASRARFVVGGDVTEASLTSAKAHYGDRAKLIRLDAHFLPFASGSYDLVLLFEAAYYLGDLPAFLSESRRVLSPGGGLVISSVNPEWSGFSPSSLSTRYSGAAELARLVREAGFSACRCYGGFPTTEASARDGVVEFARSLAAKVHLIPGTLGARAFLKRLAYGPTKGLPPEVSADSAPAPEPAEAAGCGSDRTHQIIYIVADRN